MSNQEPLLPSHSYGEDKKSLEPAIVLVDHSDDTPLIVGQGWKKRVVGKWRGLSTVQKVFIGVLTVWAVVSLVAKVADELEIDEMFERGWKGHGHGRGHGHHGKHGKHHGHGKHPHGHDGPAGPHDDSGFPLEFDVDMDDWMPNDAAFRPSEVRDVVTADFATAQQTGVDGAFTLNNTFPLSAISRHLEWVEDRHSEEREKGNRHSHDQAQQPRDQSAFALDLASGVDAELIISTQDLSTASVALESTWSGDVPSAELVYGDDLDALSVASIVGVSHKIHLILPSTARRVPPLKIRSPAALPITFHPSAAHLAFSDLLIATDADVITPDVQALSAHIFASSGAIKGHYNVSGSLVLKTVTGDIEANITASPLHHGPPPPHGHKGEDRPPPFLEGPDGSREAVDELDDDDEERVESPIEQDEEPRRQGRTKRMTIPEPTPEQNAKPSFFTRFLSFFFSRSKKHNHHHKPHSGPHHPHHPGPHHPPGPPGPPGPPPIFIGAFSTTGSITLDIYSTHFPAPYLRTLTKAFSHTGNVSVHVSRFFKGFFEAEVLIGELDIATGGNKTLEVIKRVESEKGEKVLGLIHPVNGTWPKLPRPHGPGGPGGPGPKAPKGHKEHGKDEKRSFDEEMEYEQEQEEFEMDESLFFDDAEELGQLPPPPPPPPPHHGHHKGPGGPPPPFPPHKGPGGPPPPPPPHKGPGGPPPPYPPHKGPGGPPPPPPPHKGPGGPPPPHGPGGPGPHGPHGPHGHHHPPPPPGFSKVFARTDVGKVKLRI